MKRAWVTLFSEMPYLPGVLALKKSLNHVGTAYPLVVMVTDAITPEARQVLKEAGCIVHEVEALMLPDPLNASYAAPQFKHVWPKLRVYAMSDLELAVMMDADMLVTRNMDELFDIDLPPGTIAACHACRCNPHKRSTYPADWVLENCGYVRGPPPLNGPFAMAAKDDYFNSGLFVLRPDAREYAALQDRLLSLDPAKPMPFADQDFLNDYYKGRWLKLPYIYNALKTLSSCHAEMWNTDDVKNIHYILDKPWNVQPASVRTDATLPYRDLVVRWWDVYQQA